MFPTYSTKYTEDTEALERQLSQARSKPDPVDRVRTAHYIGVHMMCTIMMHRAGQIISPLTLQTITIAQMLSVGGEGALKSVSKCPVVITTTPRNSSMIR